MEITARVLSMPTYVANKFPKSGIASRSSLCRICGTIGVFSVVLCLFVIHRLSFFETVNFSSIEQTECSRGLDAQLVLIQGQEKAKCMDGSSPGYYIREGRGDGLSKWHIHFEGGGWCYDLVCRANVLVG